MNDPLHILHLEDTLADAALLEATLKIEQFDCKITNVAGRQGFQKALSDRTIGLILSDFTMPGFDGLTALEMAKEVRPEIPFIFFSGTIGEELAVEALREGATDYVLKDRMARLPIAIRRALSDVETRKQRERDVEQLRNQAALLDLAQDAIIVQGMDQSVLFWNQSAQRLYGWSADEAAGKKLGNLVSDGDSGITRAAFDHLLHDGAWQGELHQTTKDQKKIIVQSRWSLVRDKAGQPESVLVINTDATEKREIEAQLLRTQRLETIGALAGGIAHDLNNALTPVLVALQIAQEQVAHDPTRKLLGTAQASARHGAEMVKQILSFARGVGGNPVEIDVKTLINDVVKFADDTFPHRIRIECNVASDIMPVTGNATQLHQVLLNLCVNARDAMTEGGQLFLEARNACIDDTSALTHRQSSGPHVLLTVTDTGHGMSKEVLNRIFEPFFTTKEIGKGTGLGLSTLMGIVKTHGGFVEVTSEVGKGSSFAVFLPAAKAETHKQPLRVLGKADLSKQAA